MNIQKRKKVDQIVLNKILELASLGVTKTRISKEVGLSIPSVRKFLKTGEPLFSKETYSKNESFFNEINTPEKAYWLGWVASDGNLNEKNKSITICIQKRDEDVLKLLKNIIGSDRPIFNYKSNNYKDKEYLTLQVSSKILYADIIRHGVSKNKTKTVFIPDYLQGDLFRYYLRGYFEGDGNFYISKGWQSGEISIVGQSEKIFNQIKDLVFCQTGINGSLKRKKTKSNNKDSYIFIYKLSGMRNCLAFLSWLYSGFEHLSLKRKYDSYKKELENYQKSTSNYCFPVNQLDKNGKLLKRWDSITAICKGLHYSEKVLIRLCKEHSTEIYKESLWEYGDIKRGEILLRKAYCHSTTPL